MMIWYRKCWLATFLTNKFTIICLNWLTDFGIKAGEQDHSMGELQSVYTKHNLCHSVAY